jgi:cobalt-zinc-cadmium efflux system outer membrane protein
MLLGCLSMAACGGSSYAPAQVSPRSLGAGLPVAQVLPGAAGAGQRPEPENPRDSLTLPDVLAMALLQNPSLAAFGWELRAREARVLQAGRLPNPVLGVLAEDFSASRRVGSGPGDPSAVQPQSTVQLSQVIELGGKRTGRRNLAATARDLAAWDFETARVDILTEVTRAFVEVLAAQELVAVTHRNADLVEAVAQSVTARVEAGVAAPVEAIRAEVELASAQVESHRAEQQLEASRQALAAMWGATEARFTGARGVMIVAPSVPPLAALATQLRENPDLARWASAIVQRQAELAVERARRVPDLELIAGYRRFADLEVGAAILGASITLPLFDRNSGAVREAENRLAKVFEERRAAEARVATQLAEVHAALSAAHQEVIALRSAVLPGSQRAFEAISEGYRLGRFSYLDVLEAQRTLNAANSRYLRVVADYHKAVADAERLIGAPLSGSAVPPG